MKILKKGILTSFQDLGRLGFQANGLNSGGAMDRISLKLLNIILKNDLNECAIEIHFPGPVILFEEDCIIALTGADFSANLNCNDIYVNKVYVAKIGDILSFKLKKSGERVYLGVKGGFNKPTWIKSKSTHLQLNWHPIMENESYKVNFLENNFFLTKNIGIASIRFKEEFNSIRFVPGFDFQKLNPISKMKLLETEFEIGLESNRMGYKLNGFEIKLEKEEEMVSSSVARGIIQLLPNGQLVILMADAQVTGGYPKLGFVIDSDISKLSQLGPKEKIKFVKVSLEFALENIQKTELLFEKIKKSIEYASV